MRKFIVKRFALDYITKIGKVQIAFTRSATFIYPLMVITGYLQSLAINPNVFALVASWILLATSLFLGFAYFSIKPVKYSELEDIEQIFQYGTAQMDGKVRNPEYEFLEDGRFAKAFDELEVKLEGKYYKPFRMIFHPVVATIIIITLIIILQLV